MSRLFVFLKSEYVQPRELLIKKNKIFKLGVGKVRKKINYKFILKGGVGSRGFVRC